MTFLKDAAIVSQSLDRYLTRAKTGETKVIQQQTIENIHQTLNLAAHIEKGDLTGEKLTAFLSDYLDQTTQIHHPGFFAHQVGAPHPTGALGSLVDGFTNNAMAIYEMGPGAAAIEFFMVNLILSKIGWAPMPFCIEDRLQTPHGGGVLTHGGSLANLTALLVARNCLDKDIRDNGSPSDLTLMVPQSSHYSVAKAAGIIGIGEKNLVLMETDAMGQVRPDRLEAAHARALIQGKRITALVANACSTGTGLYDPIDEIADFCKEKGIWFHVDGAHGACALFSGKYQNRLKGVAKADSLILDAHKMLRTPTVCAALMVKEAKHLDLVFEQKASYLFHDKAQPGFDFIQQTVECTKAGLGLKFFLTMAAMGEKGMAAYIDQTFDLAKSAHDHINAQKDFHCPCPPQSNILCFRFHAPDAHQLKIRDILIEQGTFYISSTEINGQRYLRIVIISPFTGLEDIKILVKAVRDAGQDLKNG